MSVKKPPILYISEIAVTSLMNPRTHHIRMTRFSKLVKSIKLSFTMYLTKHIDRYDLQNQTHLSLRICINFTPKNTTTITIAIKPKRFALNRGLANHNEAAKTILTGYII